MRAPGKFMFALLWLSVIGLGAAVAVLISRPPQVRTVVRTVQVKTIDRQASTAHLGFCLQAIQDPSTGDMQFVNATAPSENGGVVSCALGAFVPVVPGSGS